MADYRVLFRDVLSGVVHGELPVQKVSYTNTLNAPGAATVSIPLDPDARHVNRRTVITGGATAVYIERNERIVWSGLLWDGSADFAAGTYDLACEGWLSYYRVRHFHATRRFDKVDQAVIARTLLDHAGQYGPGSRLGMIRFGTELTAVLRDRTYKQSEHKAIGEAVEQLAAVASGFDFTFDTEWIASDLVTTFRVRYPALGRYRNLTLEQGRNCDIGGATVGGKSVITHAYALGAGDGPEQVWATAGTPSLIHPRLEAVDSYSDVKEYLTLKSKAERRIVLGRAPIVLPDITLYPDTYPRLDDFGLGDALNVRGGYGLVPIDGVYRVTDVAVSVSETGAESIRLTMAPREVFQDDDKPDPAPVDRG